MAPLANSFTAWKVKLSASTYVMLKDPLTASPEVTSKVMLLPVDYLWAIELTVTVVPDWE